MRYAFIAKWAAAYPARLHCGVLRVTKSAYDASRQGGAKVISQLALLKRGHVAHGLQEDLMRYRVVGNSVSRNKGRSAWHVWRTYRDVERLGVQLCDARLVQALAILEMTRTVFITGASGIELHQVE